MCMYIIMIHYVCTYMLCIFVLKAQPNDSIADVGSKPFEFTTAKYVPSLPYKLENHGPKVIVS